MVSNAEIEKIFLQQKEYSIILRKTDYKERLQLLTRLENAIENNRQKIYDALKYDLNKSEIEADLTEMLPVFKELKFFKKHLNKWMSPFRVATPVALTGSSSYYQFEPKGTSLIISPWNYPINLTICPLIAALAAGNTVIIKPSERSAKCSEALQQIIESIFEAKEIKIFIGDGNVGAQLLELPFDHIFFTGSVNTGKKILEKSAPHLTSTTLELGGKSPTIIDETADIKMAAHRIAWSKMINSGQTCIAPDYLLINENVKDVFINELKNEVEKYFENNEAGICKMIDENHLKKMESFINDLPKEVLQISLSEKNIEGQISPTLIINPANESLIMQEEIFGPLLPLITYKKIEEAIAFVQSKPKALSLYIYSFNKKNIQKILTETNSGGVVINMGLLHFINSNLPFGGVNNSGIGKSHGFAGFQAFSNQKGILKQHLFFGTAELFFPPYKNWKKKLIKFVIKYF